MMTYKSLTPHDSLSDASSKLEVILIVAVGLV